MKKILVISWFYPPINSSEGLVTYKLLKNSKYKYDVFTQKNNSSWSYSNEDYLPESKNVKCIFSSANNLGDWKQEAINYYENNKDKYDIIMTRSMPEESLEVGLAIKNINPNVIWLASFGDPVANNPFTIKSLYEENPYSIANRYKVPMSVRQIFSIKRTIRSFIWKHRYKKQNKKYYGEKSNLETKVLGVADKIICNNKYQMDYMFSKFPDKKEKAICIPHSFDATLYPKTKKTNSKMTFTYIGHLDDIRTPKLLLEAINLLQTKFPDLKEKALFQFYGNVSKNDKVSIIDYDLTDFVKIRKSISYIDSLKIMQESDWLLHFDANISDIFDDNIFFAAKLADYIGAKTNIMGITMLTGASADILRDMNSLVISHSVDEIYNYLYLIIYKNYTIKQSKIESQTYDAVNVVNLLDKEIEELCK